MEEEWQELSGRTFPINASIYGGSVDEFVRVAEFVSAKGPDFIELNISCPNSDKHGMIFGVNAQSSHDVVAAVKKVIHVPLIAKLTPAAPDIASIAKACEDAGADAICAINTAGPGMVLISSPGLLYLPLKRAGFQAP
jgi:dihydroorotate dehydrogenase (NAD+) catalytic subunit